MEVFKLLGKIALDGATEVKKGVEEIEDRAEKLGKKFETVGKRVTDTGKHMTTLVTGPLVALGAGVLALTTRTAKAGDEIQKMALRTGFSTEALSEFRHAAQLSGASIDTVEKGVKRMQKVLFDAEKGLATANDALSALNLSYEDLRKLSPEEQFERLTTAIAELEDPSRRAALAQEVFGRAGTQLLPMLSQGAEGLAEMRREAHELGIIFDQEAADKAAKFNDDMLRLQKGIEGASQELGMRLIPIFVDDLIPMLKETTIPLVQSFAERIGVLVEWFGNLDPRTQKIILAVTGLAAALGPVLIVTGKIITAMKVLAPVMAALTSPIGLVVLAVAGLVAAGIAVYNNWEKISDWLQRTWTAIANLALDVFSGAKIAILEFVASALDALGQFTSFIPGVGSAVEGLQDKVRDMIDAEKEAVQTRKEMNEATKQAKLELEKFVPPVVETEKAVKNLDQAEQGLIYTQEEQIKAAEEWVKKLLEQQLQASDTLEEQTEIRLKLLEKERESAIKEAEKQNRDTMLIRQYYENEKNKIISEASQKRAEMEKSWADKALESERQMALRSVQTVEERTQIRLEIIEEAMQEEIRKAEKLGADTTSITEYYAMERKKILETEQDVYRRTSEAAAASFVGFVDSVSSGSKSLKDAVKDMLISTISGIQKKIIAEAMAAQAIAWAWSLQTFGASLGHLAVVAAQVLPTVGALEGLKAVIRGLQEGGLVRPPGGIFQIGEGRQQEVVLPMETGAEVLAEKLLRVFAQKSAAPGAGGGFPVTASPMAGPMAGGGGQLTLKVGVLVADDAGLKELERRLRSFRIREDIRVRGE